MSTVPDFSWLPSTRERFEVAPPTRPRKPAVEVDKLQAKLAEEVRSAPFRPLPRRGPRPGEAMRRPLAERILAADHNAQRLLGNAREAEEAGHKRRAARLWAAAQKALDRWNDLAGRGSDD